MGARGHRDHAGAAGLDRRPQPVDEREVTEVVGRELRLPTRPDPRLRAGHDPGVVDDEVDRAARVEEPLGEGAHALQVAEIEFVQFDTVEAARAFQAVSGRRAGTTTRAPAFVSARVVSRPSPE